MKLLKSFVLGGAILAGLPVVVFGQGSLTPPGAPAPMMKTLDQIEPRKTLGTPGQTNTSTITISAPGSYVLVGPIQVSSGDGIVIAASNVTLDLNGFTISSSASPRAGTGITVSGDQTLITVSNGKVASVGGDSVTSHLPSGTIGFTNGISFSPSQVQASSVHRVDVGAFPGIAIEAGRVENSSVILGEEVGISGTDVKDCTLRTFKNTGIRAGKVTDCSVGFGGEIVGTAIQGTLVENCTVSLNKGKGIDAGTSGLVKNCYVTSAGGIGPVAGISAKIAIGCVIIPPLFGADNSIITHRYDMP